MAGNGFAAADRIYAFVGFGFQVDSVGRDTERFCQSFAHFGEMRAEFGALENYNDVDMVAPAGGQPAVYTRRDGTPYADIRRRGPQD